jgi:signal transduction histidine kinase
MKITLRVLCLEDDVEDFDFIVETLKGGGFELVTQRVSTRETFIAALYAFQPDIVLSDHSLPFFDSTEALAVAKTISPLVPFVLVTGAVSDEFAVKALKSGADDYILKSSLAKLPSVVENVLKQRDGELAKKKAAQELAQRNEELSKINRELDSFVYSVSHNLRAPLMSVLGLVNLAKVEKDPSDLARYHHMMETSILKLDETLKNILEYSRNARQQVKIDRIDLASIVEDNFQKMQFMPGFGNIERLVQIDDETPLFSDGYRLSVIFNNLISNSIKYLDRTKTRSQIHIAAKVTAEHATIFFTDNGIGISKELQPKVFEMFFRATQSKEGSGLGLYIVREAVDILAGSIAVESVYGEGTSFKVTIPNLLRKEKIAVTNSILADRE